LAKFESAHVFDGVPVEVFQALKRYELYPKYLQGVTSIEVLPPKAKGSTAIVKYEVNLIKKFHYSLNMFEEEPGRIWWTLEDSNLMKANDGSWKLTGKGTQQTQAVYTLDVKFKGLMPSAITDQVAKANMPSMFQGFQKLILDLRSGS